MGKKFDGRETDNGVEVFRFVTIFARTGISISVSIYRIVGLVGGHLWEKKERGANELFEKPTFERIALETACAGAIHADTKW